MKRILCILAASLPHIFAPHTAQAEAEKAFVLDFESLSTEEDSFQPGVAAFTSITATDGALGGFAFALVTETYAEAYGGPSLTFDHSGVLVSVGFGIGIEQSAGVTDRNPARFGGYFLFDSDQHLFSIIGEIGLTNKDFVEPYSYARYAWHAHESFDLGLIARRYAGIGPRIDFWMHRPGLGIAVSPLYNPESESWAGMLTFTTGY